MLTERDRQVGPFQLLFFIEQTKTLMMKQLDKQLEWATTRDCLVSTYKSITTSSTLQNMASSTGIKSVISSQKGWNYRPTGASPTIFKIFLVFKFHITCKILHFSILLLTCCKPTDPFWPKNAIIISIQPQLPFPIVSPAVNVAVSEHCTYLSACCGNDSSICGIEKWAISQFYSCFERNWAYLWWHSSIQPLVANLLCFARCSHHEKAMHCLMAKFLSIPFEHDGKT